MQGLNHVSLQLVDASVAPASTTADGGTHSDSDTDCSCPGFGYGDDDDDDDGDCEDGGVRRPAGGLAVHQRDIGVCHSADGLRIVVPVVGLTWACHHRLLPEELRTPHPISVTPVLVSQVRCGVVGGGVALCFSWRARGCVCVSRVGARRLGFLEQGINEMQAAGNMAGRSRGGITLQDSILRAALPVLRRYVLRYEEFSQWAVRQAAPDARLTPSPPSPSMSSSPPLMPPTAAPAAADRPPLHPERVAPPAGRSEADAPFTSRTGLSMHEVCDWLAPGVPGGSRTNIYGGTGGSHGLSTPPIAMRGPPRWPPHRPDSRGTPSPVQVSLRRRASASFIFIFIGFFHL